MQRRLAGAVHGQEAPPFGFGADPVLAAAGHVAVVLWLLGHPARAQLRARAAVASARNLGHVFTLAAALTQAALVELLCGNAPAGRQLADEAVSLSATHGFAFWHAVSSVLRGWASVQTRWVPEGIAQIDAALLAMQATNTRFFSAFAYAFLAGGYLSSGAIEDGLAAVNAGLAVALNSLDRAYLPELWRLKGELLLQSLARRKRSPARRLAGRGKRPETRAEDCFQRALRVARASHAKSLELRAAISLARAWHARGRTAPARRVLSSVCAWFGARASSPDLAEARTLLKELRTAPGRV